MITALGKSNVPVLMEDNMLPSVSQAVLNQMNANAGVYKYPQDRVIEQFGKPKSTLITTRGRNAGNSADADNTIYAFNTGVFNASSGLIPSWNDGFTGKNIERYVNIANCGRGLQLKTITFSAKDADGNQSLDALEGLQFTIQSYTPTAGKAIPEVLDLSEAVRNTQYQQGVLTISLDAWINGVTQLSWFVPSGYTITVNITWA